MLPRDISLEHAILDLIDNSLDGAIRQRISQIRANSEAPYRGLRCHLNLGPDQFIVSDNCGGIPDDRLEDALRLGRDNPSLDNDKPTIGMYGIGMKRSIFKICADATVESRSSTSTISVNYDEEWLDPSNPEWGLDLEVAPPGQNDFGVTITANKIFPNISKTFASKGFFDDLVRRLSRYYAYVIEKGFEISVNGKSISPLPMEFRFSDKVTPFYYEALSGSVSVKVVVGLFRKLAKEDEVEQAIENSESYDTGRLKSGITVVCNDRVIKYADTSSLTGWGMSNVPRYHPQFRSIGGVLIFESDDASSLPVSTTKGALDLDEEAYRVGLNAVMEGIKTFTTYTNRVKGVEDVADTVIARADRFSIAQVAHALGPSARTVRNSGGSAKKAMPNFPAPEPKNPMARISFSREKSEVDEVASLIGLQAGEKPGIVGEHVWDAYARKIGAKT
ncbi:ATP-binding protein [Sulfitobacter sp.]|uniref:ATP-binding protein n=1 Tax=Sulfitobacter sp. TaxID=1903071 RepID=UPI00329800A4